MGLLRWLMGPRGRGVVVGDSAFGFRVVGTSFHQEALEKIAGARSRRGYERYCAAVLLPQPSNPYDHHAVAVIIHSVEVGHLERSVAPEFRSALRGVGYADAVCEAEIVGGWDRGPEDRGYVGLRLNAFLPFRIVAADQYDPKQWHLARHGAPTAQQRQVIGKAKRKAQWYAVITRCGPSSLRHHYGRSRYCNCGIAQSGKLFVHPNFGVIRCLWTNQNLRNASGIA